MARKSKQQKQRQPGKVVPLKKGKCPNCAKPVAADFRPFCSKRCSDLDLGRWLNGEYRIPTDEVPGDDAVADDVEDDA